MSVVRFPGGRNISAPAAEPIPREKFVRLAELSLDIVELITAILDEQDGDLDFETVDPDREDGADAEPALGAPEGHDSQIVWLRGGDQDLEATSPEPH